MNYTKEDREVARNIVGNPRYMELLTKVMAESQEQWTLEALHDKDDAQVGQLVRADVLAQQKILRRFETLKTLAREEGGKVGPIAPE